MADINQLHEALINADKAGDVDAATTLAGEIRRLSSPVTPAQASFGPNPITPGQQRNRDVAGNAAKEAVAGFADMFGNAPTNVYNLGKAAVGTVATKMGHPEFAQEPTPTPDIMRNTFLKQGWINPQDAPQNTGERYLSAATQGATAGAPGGVPGMAMGAAGNVIGQGVSDLTGSPTAGTVANLATSLGANKLQQYGAKQVSLADQLKKQKAPLMDTMHEVRDAGYVMPPAMTNPSVINRILESLGGKVATQQDVSLKNQATTDALVRQRLKAPADMGITEQALKDLSDQRAQPYRDVAALPGLPPKQTGTFYSPQGASPVMGKTPPAPSALLDELRSVRLDAKLYWNQFKRNGDVDAYKKYTATTQQANSLESSLEQAVVAANRPELVNQLRGSRKDIAQIHDVERALNTDRGEVSAIDLAKARDKGVPLSGELLTAAKMGNTFPKAVQRPEQIGSPGVHNLAPMMGGMGGGGVGAAIGALAGGPGAATGGAMAGSAVGALATPYAQMLIRNMLLSKAYQKGMGTPNYDASAASRGMSQLPVTGAGDALLRAYIQSQQLKNQGQ